MEEKKGKRKREKISKKGWGRKKEKGARCREGKRWQRKEKGGKNL